MNHLQNSCLGLHQIDWIKHTCELGWVGPLFSIRQGRRRRLEDTSSLSACQPTPWGVSSVQRQTVRSSHSLSVVEIDIACPDQRGQTNVTQCLFNAALVHTWLFLNTVHPKEPFPFLRQSVGLCYNKADEVMTESDCFVQTRLTHHNSVSVGKKVSSPDGWGKQGGKARWYARMQQGGFPIRSILSVHICSLVHLEVSLGVWVWLLLGVCPLMVKVWTVQPIQRDQHLQSQCEKAGKHHNHLFHLFDKRVWFVSRSCGAHRIQCNKKTVLF